MQFRLHTKTRTTSDLKRKKMEGLACVIILEPSSIASRTDRIRTYKIKGKEALGSGSFPYSANSTSTIFAADFFAPFNFTFSTTTRLSIN